MDKYYAGIGSRETPTEILTLMTKIATYLETKGYTLRSGGADGADSAFANGCNRKEVIVPWGGYNGLPLLYPIPDEAYALASDLHPNWLRLTQGAKALMARNCMQILGPHFNKPFSHFSEFVICWTRDKCTTESERSSRTGGTGQAISLASRNNIPVFNLCREDHLQRFNFLF